MLPDKEALDLGKENFRDVVGGEPPLVRGDDGSGVFSLTSLGALSTAVVIVVSVVSGLWTTSDA